MTLKRTIELLKEYLRMNNIIELTDVNSSDKWGFFGANGVGLF